MLIDRADLTFKDALEREIARRLQGDDKAHGLYRALLACQSWEVYLRTQATILAYEDVIKAMRDLARRMNEGEEPVREPAPLYGGRGVN